MNLITITFDPAMWQLVPKEMTREMADDAWEEFDDKSPGCSIPSSYHLEQAYKAALAAAPAHQQAESEAKLNELTRMAQETGQYDQPLVTHQQSVKLSPCAHCGSNTAPRAILKSEIYETEPDFDADMILCDASPSRLA
jgi:hypothetical protein